MLEHITGGLEGCAVADLYAGSGALGLEAASRGAARVTVVERSAAAVKVIKANIATTGLAEVTVAAMDVKTWADSVAAIPGGYDIVLADPPYDTSDAELVGVLSALANRKCLVEGCDVVIERAKPRGGAVEFPWPEGFVAQSARTYGDTVLHHAVCYGQESQAIRA
jgi:16S rRNA (guanine966-N2)-methyltransferase